MSAVNNFNLIGYCAEQKSINTNAGIKNLAIIEYNKQTAKGVVANTIEVQISEKSAQYSFQGKDVAISGIIDAYTSKTGFVNVVLYANVINVLNPRGKSMTQAQTPPQKASPMDINDEDLPF